MSRAEGESSKNAKPRGSHEKDSLPKDLCSLRIVSPVLDTVGDVDCQVYSMVFKDK